MDEVLVIARIIKVEVGVISRGRRLRLITLAEIVRIIKVQVKDNPYRDFDCHKNRI